MLPGLKCYPVWIGVEMWTSRPSIYVWWAFGAKISLILTWLIIFSFDPTCLLLFFFLFSHSSYYSTPPTLPTLPTSPTSYLLLSYYLYFPTIYTFLLSLCSYSPYSSNLPTIPTKLLCLLFFSFLFTCLHTLFLYYDWICPLTNYLSINNTFSLSLDSKIFCTINTV
jgi:hypothetical protein